MKGFWLMRTGTESILSLAASPVGRRVAWGERSGKVQWFPLEGIPTPEIRDYADGWVRVIARSPNGAFIAAGSETGEILLWDRPTGTRKPLRWTGHRGPVHALAFSDCLLASVGEDEWVRLWRLPRGNHLRRLRGGPGTLRSLAFSPADDLLAAGGDDRRIRIWRVPEGRPLSLLEGHEERIHALAFSPDGRLLASGDKAGELRRWSTQEAEPPVLTPPRKAEVKALAFSGDGRELWAGWEDSEIHIFRMPGGELQDRYEGRLKGWAALALIPAKRQWVAAHGPGALEFGKV